MLPIKYFKVILTVALHCLLIVTCTKGGRTKPRSSDTLSISEVNKVLNDNSERIRLYHLIDQVSYKRPRVVPSCPKGRLYDAKAKVCSKPHNRDSFSYKREHCGENMIFLPVPNTTNLGACACSNVAKPFRWGQPQALTEHNQCAEIGTQGPCNDGEKIVPITKLLAGCDVDACNYRVEPENAIIFSKASKWDSFLYPVFTFTYKGKCFATETEGFCSRGQVVRFIFPYKVPVCVDGFEVNYPPPGYQRPGGGGSSLGQSALRNCEPGFVISRFTGKCQPQPSFDFD